MAEWISIQVVYACPGTAYVQELQLGESSTVTDALDACDLQRACPELDLAHAPVGVFGRKVQREHILDDGDRVEVYRPLQMDPMQARRQRAGQNR